MYEDYLIFNILINTYLYAFKDDDSDVLVVPFFTDYHQEIMKICAWIILAICAFLCGLYNQNIKKCLCKMRRKYFYHCQGGSHYSLPNPDEISPNSTAIMETAV